MKLPDDFDPDFYAGTYPDVALSGMSPGEHYLRFGRQLRRAFNTATLLCDERPSPPFVHEADFTLGLDEEAIDALNAHQLNGPVMTVAPAAPDKVATDTFAGFGTIEHNPLVSVLIVSHNSSRDLIKLLPSLAAQTYHNLEIILVETGTENTAALCKDLLPQTHHIATGNIGFASANNLAAAQANGELLFLINPDTVVDAQCIQLLLDAMRYDQHAALAAPKIYFYTPFVRLDINADAEFSIPIVDLLAHAPYRKLFVRHGSQSDGTLSSQDASVSLDIPHPTEDAALSLDLFSDTATAITIKLGHTVFSVVRNCDQGCRTTLQLNSSSRSNARWLVNNAGSGFRDTGEPYDRGFAEYDDGRFFSRTYLSAFCGCCALIRRTAILPRQLFADSFFAYFEDSELSWWLGRRNMRLLYCPDAIVYHKHSESTGEASPLRDTLLNRSRRIFEYLTGKQETPLGATNNASSYGGIPSSVAQRLNELDATLTLVGARADLSARSRPTLCIYNSYFYSKGGGERHALSIASAAREHYDVYLASETDFSMDALSAYFGVSLEGCKKLVNNRIDSWFTAQFDVFINSTYHSNLFSKAASSYYIVSFPHRHISADILSSYTFLHNSPFTAKWAHIFWGDHKSTTLLPILGFAQRNTHSTHPPKRKLILSVGRFDYSGHSKNHHAIVKAFRDAVDRGLITDEWSLVVAGSLENNKSDAVRYYRDLNALAQGYNISVLPNAPRAEIDAYYQAAFAYIHATGLGVPADKPEEHEHFGIAVYEALLHGCYTVVYNVGGPAEQVTPLPEGVAKFQNFEELIDSMRVLAAHYSTSTGIFPASVRHAESMLTESQLALGALLLAGKVAARPSE